MSNTPLDRNIPRDRRPVGVALAGGASRRMGRDKTRIELPKHGGETLLEKTVHLLSDVCAEVVVADRGQRLLVDAVSVNDGAGAGPAAGILGAAMARPGRDLLVLACDTPRVPATLLQALIEEEGDWVVPAWGPEKRLEPLCAIYRQKALQALARQIQGGVRALHPLINAPGLRIRRLDSRWVENFGRPAEIFLNINTPSDLAILQAPGAARYT